MQAEAECQCHFLLSVSYKKRKLLLLF